jgi:hypothetical protein
VRSGGCRHPPRHRRAAEEQEGARAERPDELFEAAKAEARERLGEDAYEAALDDGRASTLRDALAAADLLQNAKGRPGGGPSARSR